MLALDEMDTAFKELRAALIHWQQSVYKDEDAAAAKERIENARRN